MTRRPKALDLFHCQGGMAEGYRRAGFDVVGVDSDPSMLEHSPFETVHADALDVLDGKVLDLDEFDLIHASPPCQRYLSHVKMAGLVEHHPDLLSPVLERLRNRGGMWVVENVPTARFPRWAPTMTLCGSMFGLRVRRHRRFASSHLLWTPECDHAGQERISGPVIGVYGNGGAANPGGNGRRYSSRAEALEAMGAPGWMTLRGICESIPPAYAEFVGRQLLEALPVAA